MKTKTRFAALSCAFLLAGCATPMTSLTAEEALPIAKDIIAKGQDEESAAYKALNKGVLKVSGKIGDVAEVAEVRLDIDDNYYYIDATQDGKKEKIVAYVKAGDYYVYTQQEDDIVCYPYCQEDLFNNAAMTPTILYALCIELPYQALNAWVAAEGKPAEGTYRFTSGADNYFGVEFERTASSDDEEGELVKATFGFKDCLPSEFVGTMNDGSVLTVDYEFGDFEKVYPVLE